MATFRSLNGIIITLALFFPIILSAKKKIPDEVVVDTLNVIKIPVVDADKVQYEIMDFDEIHDSDIPERIIINNPDKRSSETEEEIWVAVEQQAEFPGGVQALMKWLTENLRYPEEAQENEIEGRVVVKFIVEKDGSVSNVTVVRGVHKALDSEAFRVVRSMPAWEPGRNEGEPVRSYFNLPITFRLTPEEDKDEDIDNFARGIINQDDEYSDRFLQLPQYNEKEAEEFLKMGEEAEAKGNIPHAVAFYKEAFDINPLNMKSLEMAERLLEGNKEEIVNLNNYALNVLEREYAKYYRIPVDLQRKNFLNPILELLKRQSSLMPEDINYKFRLMYYYTFSRNVDGMLEMGEILYPETKTNNLDNIQKIFVIDYYSMALYENKDYDMVIEIISPFEKMLMNFDNKEQSEIALYFYYLALKEKGETQQAEKLEDWLNSK